jgi:succinate dehydrogenase / fumarate reductase iron-sulfur subunit
VSGLLDHLNYHDDIVTDAGEKTSRIAWESSCLQGVCGACAMVINGRPALACSTFVRDLAGDVLTLQPLRKFPVLHDLVVDRDAIHEGLRRTNVYVGTYQRQEGEDHQLQYAVAKCLKCGLCLEACPNYTNGHSFLGAAFANDCYLVFARKREKAAEMRATYARSFGNACSKSLACMDVCPMDIPTIASMARLNRL